MCAQRRPQPAVRSGGAQPALGFCRRGGGAQPAAAAQGFEVVTWPGRLCKVTLSLTTLLLFSSYLANLAAALTAAATATQAIQSLRSAGFCPPPHPHNLPHPP